MPVELLSSVDELRITEASLASERKHASLENLTPKMIFVESNRLELTHFGSRMHALANFYFGLQKEKTKPESEQNKEYISKLELDLNNCILTTNLDIKEKRLKIKLPKSGFNNQAQKVNVISLDTHNNGKNGYHNTELNGYQKLQEIDVFVADKENGKNGKKKKPLKFAIKISKERIPELANQFQDICIKRNGQIMANWKIDRKQVVFLRQRQGLVDSI